MKSLHHTPQATEPSFETLELQTPPPSAVDSSNNRKRGEGRGGAAALDIHAIKLVTRVN